MGEAVATVGPSQWHGPCAAGTLLKPVCGLPSIALPPGILAYLLRPGAGQGFSVRQEIDYE